MSIVSDYASTVTSLTKRVNKAMQEYESQKTEWKKEKEELVNQINLLIKEKEDVVFSLNSDKEKLNDTISSLREEIDNLKPLDKENKSLKKQLAERDKTVEKNSVDITKLVEKEKGWSIREKQLIDGFNSFKEKTYLTIKHLVEDVIEPLEEKALENPSSIIIEEELKEQIESAKKIKEAEVTIRTNSGPEKKKLIIKPAEKELQEMIENN